MAAVLIWLFFAGIATQGQIATLSSAYTNPSPASYEYFGSVVAAVGEDKVIIGAEFDGTGAPVAGAAYLFGTNGALLATYTNPIPASGEQFGCALASVGTNRIAIGALFDNSGVSGSGAAYLYDLKGTRVLTFTNPAAVGGDYFGDSVAAVGPDRVLIGATRKSIGTNSASNHGFCLSHG